MQVFVTYNELGTAELVPIRGSPFTIDCADPWVNHRVMGTFPPRRKGATLAALGSELVVYGGDKSGKCLVQPAGSQQWYCLSCG